jgi:hypothetical protein
VARRHPAPEDGELLALASEAADLSQPDAAPEDVLNRAIWHSVKGYQTPYPRLAHSSLVPRDDDR